MTMCQHVCIYADMYACMLAYMHACECICIYANIYTSMQVFMHICQHVCIYGDMYAYIYIHIYICTRHDSMTADSDEDEERRSDKGRPRARGSDASSRFAISPTVACSSDLTRLACLWLQQEMCGRRPAKIDPFAWACHGPQLPAVRQAETAAKSPRVQGGTRKGADENEGV